MKREAEQPISEAAIPASTTSLGDDSGQAMAEYAIVVAGLMGVLILMGFQIIPEFIRAFQVYHDSYYTLLSLPFP